MSNQAGVLASIPSPPASWAAFPVWIFTIHTYAICILIGIIVAVVVTSRRLTARGAEPGVVLDITVPTIILGLVGARAYHVLTHPIDYFGPGHPWYYVFEIWLGGNAIFGSLIGGAVGIWLGCRWTGVRFLSFADALAPGLLIAQAIGRIGNWFNTELYGMPTSLPWGLQVPSDNPAYPKGLPDGTLFSPTFLYELIWDAAGAAIILAIEYRVRVQMAQGRPQVQLLPRIPLRWGRAIALYFIWYGLGRSWFESIRLDPTTVVLGLRINVWTAFLTVLLGLVLLAWSRSRHVGEEASVYRLGRQWAPNDRAVGSVYTAADFAPETAQQPAADRADRVVTATSGGPTRR